LKKIIIVLQGTTASGKTSLSIEIAKMLNADILSADSRQFYKELEIGVARPNINELSQVRHHFIASHSIHEAITAATFSKEARRFTEDYFKHKDILIVVGGSGMYIDAYLYGLDDLPKDTRVMREILKAYEQHGTQYLINEIQSLDENALKNIDIQNPRRLMRLLEVLRISGLPLKSQQTGDLKPINIPFLRFSIDWSRKDLYDRINSRVDAMLENGLEKEVNALKSFSNLSPLQTVGYQEWTTFENSRTLAIEKIKQHTRNYAKRQLTWLNKYEDLQRLNPYLDISLKEQMISILQNNGMIIENKGF
jgi:tRNA dimethylallyltransferase